MQTILDPRDADKLAYGVDAAARSLDVSPRTIWNLIEDGTLRKVRIGRRTLVPASDLKALAEGMAA